jgi:hypothetical protein
LLLSRVVFLEYLLLLIDCFFRAEVVELAHTPSDAIALSILYKLLILQLLLFGSITSVEPSGDGQ